MSIKLNAASGGSITLKETNTASNFTLTLPARNGTLGGLTASPIDRYGVFIGGFSNYSGLSTYGAVISWGDNVSNLAIVADADIY